MQLVLRAVKMNYISPPKKGHFNWSSFLEANSSLKPCMGLLTVKESHIAAS